MCATPQVRAGTSGQAQTRLEYVISLRLRRLVADSDQRYGHKRALRSRRLPSGPVFCVPGAKARTRFVRMETTEESMVDISISLAPRLGLGSSQSCKDKMNMTGSRG